MLVGCLPSFAIFVRGRVQVSPVQFDANAAETSKIPHRRKAPVVIDSLMVSKVEEETLRAGRHSSDVPSGTTSAEGDAIFVTKVNQDRQNRTASCTELEHARKLGLRNRWMLA